GLPEATSLALAGTPREALEGEAPLWTLLEILDEAVANPPASIPEGFATVSAHAKDDVLTVKDGAGGSVEGRYAGVDADGALHLTTLAGDERVISGDVILF